MIDSQTDRQRHFIFPQGEFVNHQYFSTAQNVSHTCNQHEISQWVVFGKCAQDFNGMSIMDDCDDIPYKSWPPAYSFKLCLFFIPPKDMCL